MKTAIVIPWWPGTTCEWRHRWRRIVTDYWRSSGLGQVVFGYGIEGAARNSGVEAAQADVFLVTDADSLIPWERAAEALRLAGAESGLVIPHSAYAYLGQNASEAIARLPGSVPSCFEPRPESIEFTGQLGVGGPVAFNFDTWIRAGYYDEGIVRGYDAAFALACDALVGNTRRLAGDYLHLWHPRKPDETPPETHAILREYHEAAENGLMHRLIVKRQEAIEAAR